MGVITGQQILDRAWIKANDNGGGGGVRWPTAEGLMWINDGQREVVNYLPESNPKRVNGTLVAGPRQTLAGLGVTDGIAVLDVRRIVGGNSISRRSRKWIDHFRPEWPTGTGSVYHWMHDERDPTAFDIWKASVGSQVELVYGALPTDLAAIGNTITISDIYANALQWFVLFSFFSKDISAVKSAAIADNYWAKFLQSVGARSKAINDNDTGNAAAAQGEWE